MIVMSAAQAVRDRILAHGLSLASTKGLHTISIGELARELELSRSGLFLYFPTKERLQLAILEQAANMFQHDVIDASEKSPPGEARMRAMFANWITWSTAPHLKGGCPFVHASADASELPQAIRTRLKEVVAHWHDQLSTAINEAKHLSMDKSIDTEQMVFELYGLYLSHHFWHWSMKDSNAQARTMKAFENMLASARAHPCAA